MLKSLAMLLAGAVLTLAAQAIATQVTSATVHASCNADGTINVWTTPKP